MSRWEKEFAILALTMDKREDMLSKLYAMFPNYEDCPDCWKKDWKAYEKDGFKSWRKMPRVIRRLRSAAKKKCE